MNAAATLTAASALVALAVGVRARRLSLAPGSAEQRWFAVVVLASAAYAAFNLATTLPASPRTVFLVSGVEIAVLDVLLWGWVRFSQEFAGVAPSRAERLVATALVGAAPVLAIPGVLFAADVQERPFAPLGVVYRQPPPTLLGDAVLVVLLAVAAAVLVRLVGAARRGVRHAGAISAGYATMLAFACWDAACVSLPVTGVPYVLDWGFAPAVLAVDWMIAARAVESARALDQLRGELLTQVAERTRELSGALERLHASEKLVALGRFANGVAHEVNNPAAVVTSSLSFLADRAGPRLAPDEADALDDARTAMSRLTFLVRRLADAARVAQAVPGRSAAELSSTIDRVVARQPAPVRAGIRTRALAGAWVRIRPDALDLIVESLVLHAVDVPRDLTIPVEVAVDRVDGRIRVTVAGRRAEASPERLAQAFDPFFSTAAAGRTGGIGLALARGLAHANGGDLSLVTAPGAGTRAILELPVAEAADAADAGQPAEAS